MEKKDLLEGCRQVSESNGATLFGVADLKPVRAYIEENYDTRYLDLNKAVVVGVPYPKEIVNELEDGPTHTYLYYYKILNTKLDDIALQVALKIERAGYRSFPIPASQRVTDSRLNGIFSHRLAAHLAGFGWIGKNSSLITKAYGPRLRLVTILTDAPLVCNEPFTEDFCGGCNACKDACPSGAILGKLFNPKDALDERFIGQRCDQHLSKVRTTFGKRICGKCLSACPHGK